MFELELINLIKEYGNTADIYDKKKIKNSISRLITQNPEKYQKFLQINQPTQDILNFLKECETYIEEQKIQTNTNDDYIIIKNYYINWLENYVNNNNTTNENCNQIIEQIIKTYAANRFEIIEKILNLDDDSNYESFKWHLKNKLRAKLADKIEEYIISENYQKLNFIKKLKKKNEINSIINEIGNYKFNLKKIEIALS